MSAKDIFNKISYLQYPLGVVSIFYYVLFVISLTKNDIDWSQLNNVLVIFGLSISFSTLQDTSKTQNKFSRKIWESPRKGKLFLIYMSLLTLVFIATGLIGFLKSTENIHKEILDIELNISQKYFFSNKYY